MTNPKTLLLVSSLAFARSAILPAVFSLVMFSASVVRGDLITTGWVNWTPPGSYPSTANTSPTSGWWGTTYPYTPTLSGNLTMPDNSVVNVTLLGEVIGIGGTTEFHNTGPGIWNDTAAFTSENVPALPPTGTRLALAGWGASTQTLNFSAPVSNITMIIASLGSPGTPATWTFNQPVTVLSSGNDLFEVSENGLQLTGREGKGVIQFGGTFSSFSWTVSAPEMFAFYNVGVTSASIAGVPEPGQVAASILLLAGIGGYVWMKRRKAAKAPAA